MGVARMKKKITIIIVAVIGILVFLGVKFIKIPNPIMVNLQKQIEAEVGPEFQISEYDLYSKEANWCISVNADEDQFKDEDIFVNVNKIQEIVYAYVKKNEKYFVLDNMQSNDNNGFILYICNNDALPALSVVFSFSNYIVNEKTFSEDYVSVHCDSYDFGKRGYGYKISQIKELKNVKELQAHCFEIDDVTVLGQMEGLECFFANIEGAKNEEDYEDLKNTVEKQGIHFEPW